ncbi:MAG TPA: hypothetical protein PLB39_02555 [Thermoleophilia bacterium]|nr:hypothetical protein [Thermoleophilia bacterium]
MRWIVVVSLLFAAHINLTALVPAAAGQAPPPWWVGGRLLWPFGLDTHTLLPAGGVLGTLTPLLGIASATLFLLAAGAVLHWVVPAQWLAALVLSGAAASVALQVVWFSPWAVLPLLLDGLLVWGLFSSRVVPVGVHG